MKFALLDPMAPSSHNGFVRGFVRDAGHSVIFIAANHSVVRDFPDIKSAALSEIDRVGLQGKLRYARRAFLLWRNAKRVKADAIVWLSFDSIAHLMLMFCTIGRRKDYLVCHYNLDVALTSWFHRAALRLLSLRFGLVCMVPGVEDEVKRRLGVATIYRPHPLPPVDASTECAFDIDDVPLESQVIFAPSGGLGDIGAQWLTAAASQGAAVFAKTDLRFQGTSVQCREYFHDYFALLLRANFVFISAEYSFRVSGPLMEAVALGKSIIFVPSLSSRSLLKHYPCAMEIGGDTATPGVARDLSAARLLCMRKATSAVPLHTVGVVCDSR